MDEEQRRLLEQMFNQTPKPTVAQKEHIAARLKLASSVVRSWFTDRRTKAKEDKLVEERQAWAALENAHHVSPLEQHVVDQTRTIDHRTQSEASYASLARSLYAAAACMPTSDTDYEQSLPPSPAFPYSGSFSSYTPTIASAPSFDMSDSYMMRRSDSQFSTVTTPGEFPEQSAFPFYQSSYLPTAQAAANTMIYGISQEPLQVEAPKLRPRLQRTWTAPEQVAAARPIPRRTISGIYGNENDMNEAPKIRRRPKLSPLGVGMARSRSSLGYDESEYPGPRRPAASREFPYPITPVRRIHSAVAVPTLSTMSTYSPPSSQSESSPESIYDDKVFGMLGLHSSNMQFPPSPISPEHAGMLSHTGKTSCFTLANDPIPEDGFTPPSTPLSVLNPSSENILAGHHMTNTHWTVEASKLGHDNVDFMYNDITTLNDIFTDQELALHSS